MIYWQLFWSFFQIGLFSIGGGYAAMPLIQHQVVDVHPWLTMAQFSDIITISQMTPGPISINSATFVGLQVGGIPGAVIATIGNVLPSCIIVLSLAFAYYRYRKLHYAICHSRSMRWRRNIVPNCWQKWRKVPDFCLKSSPCD